MIDRYYIFRKILDFVNEDFIITDARMKDYMGDMVVEGECPEGTIIITVTSKKEVQKDA
jgi:hypothetical protein